ncbi:MAG: SUMF1/EgtB/PvdO family nonheme iron enzyme [Deltaproteobacteria bacterium]|nr:SUMF1/EgtB/PvdO family nonheme iron enzyme [Deltaproteobacteria bacterium]
MQLPQRLPELSASRPAPGLLAIALLSVLAAGAGSRAGSGRPVVAVFDIQLKLLELEKAERDMLTGVLSTELSLHGIFQVMPPGDVKKALLVQAGESHRECYDEKCQIELGRQLPADKLLTATVVKVGTSCRVSASIYDLKRQTTDFTARKAGGCSLAELVESIDAIAAEIRAWGKGAGPVEQARPGSGEPAESLPAGFVEIPAGRFTMGSPAGEPGRGEDETQHQVTISRPFLLQTTEVTQGQYRALMGENPSHFSACGDGCPVEQVSWQDATAYANAMSRKEGLEECYSKDRFKGLGCKGYRLPTEAEWEYAARAGSAGAIYAGPLTLRAEHDAPELDPIAWYGGNSGVGYQGGVDCSGWSGKQYAASSCGTQPAGKKRPNAWGLCDMLGNVWEWCHDWYGAYPAGSVTDPLGPSAGQYRVNRGSGACHAARYCRSAQRGRGTLDYRTFGVGFRLARSR